MRRAGSIKVSPSTVSATLWVSRENRLRPRLASNRLICWLTVDWRVPSARAAAVKLPVSATVTKASSKSGCIGSMVIMIDDNCYYCHHDCA